MTQPMTLNEVLTQSWRQVLLPVDIVDIENVESVFGQLVLVVLNPWTNQFALQRNVG